MNKIFAASVLVSLAFALVLFLFVLSYPVFVLFYFIIIPWMPGFIF